MIMKVDSANLEKSTNAKKDTSKEPIRKLSSNLKKYVSRSRTKSVQLSKKSKEFCLNGSKNVSILKTKFKSLKLQCSWLKTLQSKHRKMPSWLSKSKSLCANKSEAKKMR